MGAGASVRSVGELNVSERHRVVEFLSADPRGNALLLSDLLALPDLCDVRVLRTGRGWVVAGSRRDLPFHALTFSPGDAGEYRTLIGAYRGVFGAGDGIYSLIPKAQTSSLAGAVTVCSSEEEIQLLLDFATLGAGPIGPPAYEAEGFCFRALASADADAVRQLMAAEEMFAFSETSFRQGLYVGALTAGHLVSVAGTHSLGRHTAEIGNVVTGRDYRRRGLARACLSLLLNGLAGRTASVYLFLFSRCSFLQPLYTGLGFHDPRPFDLVQWRYPGDGTWPSA